MAADCTHGQVVQLAGNTTTAELLIGAIELPARGTNWILHNLTGQVARATATAAELIGGHINMRSPSGDLTPDPQPSSFGVYESASFLGATADASRCPIHRYDLDFEAAGKANVSLYSVNDIAPTVAPLWVGGIQYGPEVPAPPRGRYSDVVRSTITTAARNYIGQIQLSEKAQRIVGIWGSLMQDGVLVAGEELVGYFDLQSDDVDMIPSQWMFNDIYGAGLGATIEGGCSSAPNPHVVNIPVIGGARIACYATLLTAVTNGANVAIYLLYV